MSGNIKVKTHFKNVTGASLAQIIAEAHQYTSQPKFGGELEVMGLLQNSQGSLEPAGYDHTDTQMGMRGLIDNMLVSHGFGVKKSVDGKPSKIISPEGEIICFENYAAVVERADKAYAPQNGLATFAESIDKFSQALSAFSKISGIKFSPFDYDVFCQPSDFEGKHSPRDRFGDGGLLSFYDAQHPLVEEIDMRTTSSHFSVGYKDPSDLWRMIKVMTVLTPSLYAAFAGSPPTEEATYEGQKTILPKNKAKALEAEGHDIQIQKQLLVPRARMWTLTDADRTGINPHIADAVCDPESSFADYVRLVIDSPVVMYGEKHATETFKNMYPQLAGKELNPVDEYMTHVSTFWYDIRVDMLRLEARMAGNAPWKSKAIGALMTTILLNDDALKEVEKIIEGEQLSADDILQARHDVAEYGINTSIGGNGLSVGDLLSKVLFQAYVHIEPENKNLLDPLQKILDTKMPDSEFLKSVEGQINGDYSGFLDLDYHTLEPFVMMAENGRLDHILNPLGQIKEQTCVVISQARLAL